jgi:branched-chain amino acid transport system permease protein
MFSFKEIKQSLIVAAWFIFLTFPIMVIRVNTIEDVIEWRWLNMVYMAVASFVLSFVWRYMIRRKERGSRRQTRGQDTKPGLLERLNLERFKEPKWHVAGGGILAILLIAFPFFSSMYQTNIMTTALMYVMLGLGLNIVIGLGGMLHLGYIAFYAVGAYTYALMNHHFGVNFWMALPLGALLSVIFGVLLAIPVLRLRGDYLAIVTLGFGEIIRLVLENWNQFSFGPSGISQIPRPDFFGMDLSLGQSIKYIYYLMILMTLFTIFVVNRLKDSRIGRAWVAMREDEIACRAMGIDTIRVKITTFTLGAVWAGLAGVFFAAKTTFINPASFTVWESVLVLCIVVLGGMGSILGIILGAVVLILMPEYLRAFSEYRLLIFGAALVLMMVFRPGGIITAKRKRYTYTGKSDADPVGVKDGGRA